MLYYLNDSTGEVRIVKSIDTDHFVVVKIISDKTCSVKIWQGNLVSTANRWNTKPIFPTVAQATVWDIKFSEAVHEAFSVLTNCL